MPIRYDDFKDELRRFNRKYLHKIWEHAKNNDLDILSNEDKQLAKIMLEHEDEFFNRFQFADVLEDYEFDQEKEVNPFIHIAIHDIIENQLNSRDPIEVYQYYLAMRKRKLSHHNTIHLIGCIFSPLLFCSLKHKTIFNENKYKQLLEIYKDKKPEEILSALDTDINSILKV
ncbi:MAG: DUF1841 family protein [Candidatus Marinimicrobia bacterium]|nr:DUF1841 family protein [Candidatus Neomarinimicrobiota bacterium]